MTAPWHIACDGAELVVEVARIGDELSLDVEPRMAEDPSAVALAALAQGAPAGLVVSAPPEPELLVALAQAAPRDRPVVAAILGAPDAAVATLDLAGDLGIVAVDEVRPLASAIALIEAGARKPWAASLRALPEVDRVRLAPASADGRGGGRLARVDDGLIGWASGAGTPTPVGEPRDVALALAALHAAHGEIAGVAAAFPGAPTGRPEDVLDVIFGPPRALSDPASKAALAPYGIPLPLEELCTSPSRAAAEAARLGFPVRIALASPDLRVWDHPDLAIDGVDNSARVRDVFRQIMTLAEARAPSRGDSAGDPRTPARLLGVTVTATTAARALLRVALRPLTDSLVLAEIGFADPHGRRSGDHTHTILPAPAERIERVLGRLAGSELVVGGTSARRRETVDAVANLLARSTAFVVAHREEIETVEIDPLALLLSGAVEAREACVTVGDAFLRSLDAAGS